MMNTFHLPVAAVAFGFLLGCGGFIFYRAIFMRTKYLLLCGIQISYHISGRHKNQLF